MVNSPSARAPPEDEKKDVVEAGKLTFLQACGLNTMNMFGTGPLITIPYCVAAVNPMGPHAVWGYGVACIACICDSLVWGEIGSMWPESGGTYVYLRELFGRNTWGRLVSFMFVWQFFISGPAEAASGFIAVAEYLSYFSQDTMMYGYRVLISLCLLIACILLLARKLTDIGRATMVLWFVTIGAMLYTIVTGFTKFDSANLKTPDDAFKTPYNSIWIIAAATRFGVYDMTGYYDVCFMGGEVQDAKKTIPRSCIFTCLIVAVIYILCYMSILGSMPWESFIDQYVDDYDGVPMGIMSLFTDWRFGAPALTGFITIIVAITIFGSTFAMLIGFVFIPVAAARDGYFFDFFAPKETERKDGLPVVSTAFITILTGIWCLFSLDIVIDAMTTMIVLVMFCGQSAGLIYYRYTIPREEQPEGWRMPLFPLPCVIQFILFFFIFITSEASFYGGEPILELSVAFLLLGVLMFLGRSRYHKMWPFLPAEGKQQMEGDTEDEELPSTSPKVSLAKSPSHPEDLTAPVVIDLNHYDEGSKTSI